MVIQSSRCIINYDLLYSRDAVVLGLKEPFDVLLNGGDIFNHDIFIIHGLTWFLFSMRHRLTEVIQLTISTGTLITTIALLDSSCLRAVGRKFRSICRDILLSVEQHDPCALVKLTAIVDVVILPQAD